MTKKSTAAPRAATRTANERGNLRGTAEEKVALPRWDAARRELCLDGRLVKRFRRPAANQEIILAAFEEEGWPPAIDDPLPGAPGIDPRERLHEAVRRLNGSQKDAGIHFERDGSGCRVLWRVRG